MLKVEKNVKKCKKNEILGVFEMYGGGGDQNVCALMLQLFNYIRYRNDFW